MSVEKRIFESAPRTPLENFQRLSDDEPLCHLPLSTSRYWYGWASEVIADNERDIRCTPPVDIALRVSSHGTPQAVRLEQKWEDSREISRLSNTWQITRGDDSASLRITSEFNVWRKAYLLSTRNRDLIFEVHQPNSNQQESWTRDATFPDVKYLGELLMHSSLQRQSRLSHFMAQLAYRSC